MRRCGVFVALFVRWWPASASPSSVWHYREPNAGPVSVVLRNDDRWLDDLLAVRRRIEAATAELEQRGTAALPLIRRTLQDPAADPAHRKAALKARRSSGRAPPSDSDVTASLEAIVLAGSRDRPQLHGIHGGSVAARGDKSDEPVVRREALRALAKLRERASIDPQIVVPLLLEALNDHDPAVRNVAVTYLGIVRDNPDKEVAGLIKALADEQAEVRQAAAVALSAYGLLAEPAIPALKKATNDPDDEVKREAGRALVHLSELKNR
jgi:HEAT repeat protein